MERKLGRLLRDPEEHPQDPPASDPPADPPVDPNAAPADPPKDDTPPEYVPLTADALTFPEGVEVDEGLRDEFLSAINNQELEPAARAQALMDLHLKVLQQASDQGSTAWTATQTQWQEQARADPDIGGDKLESTVLPTVAKAIEKFGSPEFREAMDLTGAGNHPAVIKFMYNMAKQFSEGGPVSGQSSGGGQSLAEKMFPSMAKG